MVRRGKFQIIVLNFWKMDETRHGSQEAVPSFLAILLKLTEFLEPYRQLTDARMATFYIDDGWYSCFGEMMLADGCKFNSALYDDLEQIYDDLFVYCQELHSSISNKVKIREPKNCFEALAKRCFLEAGKIGKVASDHEQKPYLKEEERQKNFPALFMMSEKKFAEVQSMSDLIADLGKRWNLHNIVDFGCGKGYLSAMLALRHNANVFGLDSNEATVAAAMSRFGRMSKQWSALKKRLMTPPDVLKDTPGSLTVVPCVVRSDLNADSYVPSGENYLLCGLHTCGSLGNDITEVFLKNERSTGLCFVGCCYHYMEEEFDRCKKLPVADGHLRFPLSSCLKEKKFSFEKNTRMLASQSIDRTLREGQLRLDASARSLFFRALFQVCLVESTATESPDALEPDDVRVGKIPVDLNMSFSRYVEEARQICGYPLSISLVDCEKIHKRYRSLEVQLKIVNLLRILLGACVEQVMLLDRLCYLQEHKEVAEVGLIAMFDPVVSPRSWAIYGRKDSG